MKSGAALIVVLLALGIGAVPVWACDGEIPGTPQHGFTSSDAVFTGRLTSINGLTPSIIDRIRIWVGLTQPSSPLPSYNRFTFTVIESWKGVTTRTIDIDTFSLGMCGFDFVIGREYLVYASGGVTANLSTSIFTRTSLVSAATADLTYLATLPTLPLPKPTPATSPYIAPLLLIGAAGLVFALLEFRRKRRAAKT
jgi:hypothetical protein